MQTLAAWANRWQLPPAAWQELLQVLGAGEPPATRTDGLVSEAGVQQTLRLEAARRGGRLWRNNSGACQDEETGRQIRYGLGNDSAAVNKVFKSSDLIGITPRRCACGHLHGVFTAYEVKAPGWRLRPGDQRAQAQFNFIRLVVSLGGIGRFITDPSEL